MGGLADRIAVVRQQLEELRQPRNRPTRARLEAALDEFASSLDDLEDLSDQLDAETEGLTRAAERIDDERRRFEDLFELAPDGYVVTDSGGRVMEANRELLGMLGLSYEAVDGLPIAVFFDGEGRRRLYEVLDRSTRGEVLPAWQTVIEPRGGRPFPASVRCAARHDSDGRAVGVRLIIRDISAIVDAHRREEDAFDAARQRLAELTVLQEATREIAGLLDGPAIVRAIARHASRIRPESSVHAGVLEVTEHAARVVAHHDPSGLADHSGAVIQLTPDPRLLDSVGSPHPWTWQAGELSKMARRVVAPLGLLHGAMVGIPGGVEGIHLAVATSGAYERCGSNPR